MENSRISLRFAIVPDTPWTDLKEINGSFMFSGYYKDIFHYLVRSINVSYSLHMPSTTGEEALKETFRMMTNKEADVSIGLFSATEERWKDVRFSVVFTTGYFSILSVPIGQIKEYSSSLLKIFSVQVWLLLLVVFLLTVLSNWLMTSFVCNKKRKHAMSLLDHFFYLFGTILSQGYRKLPASNSARILTATWLFAIVILISQTSSVLVSIMTVIGRKDLIDELKDIIKFPNIRPIIGQGLVAASYIQKSADPDSIKLWQQIQSQRGEMSACNTRSQESVNLVLQESAVLILDIYDIYDVVSKNCHSGRHFHLSRGHFLDTFLAFLIRKELDQHLVEDINRRILYYVGTGQLQKLFRDHYTKSAPCMLDSKSLKDSNRDERKPLKIKDFHCVFRLLLIGIIFSCLCLCVELVMVWRNRRLLLTNQSFVAKCT